MSDTLTFVGFGFGPIQAGLFVKEAFLSRAFGRCVVAEIDARLVAAVRAHHNRYAVNVAHADGIESLVVEGVSLLNPNDGDDRARLVEALAEAHEVATCLPSVAAYGAGGACSASALLAEGLSAPGRGPVVVYAAENNNRAAEVLDGRLAATGLARRRPTALLNTVIGKMSRVVDDPAEIGELGLAPIAPGFPRAFLVEAFNHILVSRPPPGHGFRRALSVFEEKDDLLPFEEAKLYGHNAIHTLLGFLGAARGIDRMSAVAGEPGILRVAREAFLDECGAALIRKHAATADPLFTPEGFGVHAADLLARMTNPHLADTTARAARDPARKLGYDDRIFGAMRLALSQGIEPRRLAEGAAAGLSILPDDAPRHGLGAGAPGRDEMVARLGRLWQRPVDEEMCRIAALVHDALVGAPGRLSA
jgi:mannitol-1-phosphate 5-dehydrogenase